MRNSGNTEATGGNIKKTPAKISKQGRCRKSRQFFGAVHNRHTSSGTDPFHFLSFT